MYKLSKITLSIMSILMIAFMPYSHTANISAQEQYGGLRGQIDALLKNDPNLRGALVGISIRSAVTGEELYDHMGDIRLRPASNMKLLTAAAALSSLGEDYRFTTEVSTDGAQKGKSLDGNLYLIGKGDPTLLKKNFDKFAEELKRKGITVIHGDLIGDDTWYDDVRHSVDLPWSDENTYYGAQVSALTASPNNDYDAGTIIVEVSPNNKVGQKANIKVTPNTDYMKIINKTKMVTEDKIKDISIEREHGTNHITIEGTIPLDGGKVRDWVSVWEPTNFALDLFENSLQQQGIKLEGKVVSGKTPKHAKRLITHHSIPLSELLVPFMKLSNNGHAETLIKEMGKVKRNEGSWENGLKVLEEEITALGVASDTLVLRDGSGVSHVNLVPPIEISKLLFSIQNKEWFQTYVHSLPVAGVKDRLIGGTLRNRMNLPETKNKVFAKTGTISTVSSLSGYIETKSGEKLIFSIILNNLIDDSIGKDIEDKIVTVLARQ